MLHVSEVLISSPAAEIYHLQSFFYLYVFVLSVCACPYCIWKLLEMTNVNLSVNYPSLEIKLARWSMADTNDGGWVWAQASIAFCVIKLMQIMLSTKHKDLIWRKIMTSIFNGMRHNYNNLAIKNLLCCYNIVTSSLFCQQSNQPSISSIY